MSKQACQTVQTSDANIFASNFIQHVSKVCPLFNTTEKAFALDENIHLLLNKVQVWDKKRRTNFRKKMLINGSATLTFRTALYLWLYEVYASLRTKPEPNTHATRLFEDTTLQDTSWPAVPNRLVIRKNVANLTYGNVRLNPPMKNRKFLC